MPGNRLLGYPADFFYFHILNPAIVKIRAYFLIVFLCCSAIVSAQTYTVETVPNAKLVNGSYVSNPDHIISDATVASIDSILKSLESGSTAQVALVVLQSIGEDNDFDFAQRLFERWGIGQVGNDNGLLILFVNDQRTIRFHTGDGLEGVLPDAVCKQIQREYMVPHFKEGKYDDGLLSGVQQVSRILTDPSAREEIKASNENSEVTDDELFAGFILILMIGWLVIGGIIFVVKLRKGKFRKNEQQETPRYHISAGSWFWWYMIVPVIVLIAIAVINQVSVLFGGLYAYLMSMTIGKRIRLDREADQWLEKKDYQGLFNLYQQNRGYFNTMRFFFPLPMAFLYAGYKKKMDFYRNHPRNCKQCNAQLTKLDEQADDKYLSKGQIREEELKSVDYDVWFCKSCNSQEILNFLNEKTKYSPCPQCSFYTFYVASNRTLRAATTSSSGEGEEIKQCKFCNHKDVRRYTIAQIQQSSSSSGGGSSSSGGSWGGGSSSGGGASSRW